MDFQWTRNIFSRCCSFPKTLEEFQVFLIEGKKEKERRNKKKGRRGENEGGKKKNPNKALPSINIFHYKPTSLLSSHPGYGSPALAEVRTWFICVVRVCMEGQLQ